MVKTMRARTLVAFFFISTLVWGAVPSLVFATSTIPYIFFDSFPEIYAGGVHQTALKAGDRVYFRVGVTSPYIYSPLIAVDLSELGIQATTTPASSGSPNYNSYSQYDFGPLTIGPEISDGQKTVSAIATDMVGDTVSGTVHVVVDSIPPTISLSSITFSTTSPHAGDSMYLSGTLSGTGTKIIVGSILSTLLDAGGVAIGQWPHHRASYDIEPLITATASSSDGTFVNVPIRLLEDEAGEIAAATSLKLDLSFYDEAGNSSSTSFTVLVPKPAPPDPCIAADTCVSSVLFLPGIEGSRLYRPDYNGGTDKLWEPNIDSDVQDLYLNPDGTSVRFDIYAKEKDVIDELPDGENIYKSFIGKMNDLKTSAVIADWEPIAYDWRLSLDDILTYGNKVQNKIYYSGDLRATSTPYVMQELRRLAATSKTGKVTIVAHSNGGLLAKRLTELLGPTESSALIDKIIFVAVPQAGTPTAIAAGLHGYGQENVLGLVTSKSTARTLASAAPMVYQLLPSLRYFNDVDDPVVTFDASLPDWVSHYGSSIHSQNSLHQFLTDTFGRVDPQGGNINQPIQLSETLLSNAEALHKSLDTWTPPAGTELIQIAGWGVPKTVEGITYKKKGTGVTPEANFTIDGDGTVVTPSALWTSTTTGATNYWMNLRSYNVNHPFSSGLGLTLFDHSRILETDSVINFISDQLTNTVKPLSGYGYLSTEAPADSNKRLRYALHSPLTLNLYDADGHHTGVSTSTGQIEEQIPGTYYTEFGDVKYLFSDASTNAHVIMNGYAEGTFTLAIDEYSGNTPTTSTTFKDMPTTASTSVSLNILSDVSTLSSMTIDENGDGKDILTVSPKVGETVSYVPPVVAATTPPARAAGGPSYSPYIPITDLSSSTPDVFLIATTSPDVATTSVVFATTTLEATTASLSIRASRLRQSQSVPPALTKNMFPNFSQTASVYGASQQPVLKKLGAAVYNGLHRLWSALMKFF